jgi:prepilin-type N-terminal cleavage/methylation domain-containing protein
MMQLQRRNKAGYTLVEVLIVVSIMGILSSIGVAGLRSAIANARVKDAALNTTAFLERMANESRRLSADLCVVKDPGIANKLLVYQADGSGTCHGTLIDHFEIDSPNKFVNLKDCGLVTTDWLGNTPAIFSPRRGLSAAPLEGAVCVQYGNDERYGAAHKIKSSNSIIPKWKIGKNSSWTDL